MPKKPSRPRLTMRVLRGIQADGLVRDYLDGSVSRAELLEHGYSQRDIDDAKSAMTFASEMMKIPCPSCGKADHSACSDPPVHYLRLRGALAALVAQAEIVESWSVRWQPLTPGDVADLVRAKDRAKGVLAEAAKGE